MRAGGAGAAGAGGGAGGQHQVPYVCPPGTALIGTGTGPQCLPVAPATGVLPASVTAPAGTTPPAVAVAQAQAQAATLNGPINVVTSNPM